MCIYRINKIKNLVGHLMLEVFQSLKTDKTVILLESEVSSSTIHDRNI